MKVVDSTKAPSVVKAVSELSRVKLVPLTEHDDIEVYSATFEQIMQMHKVDEGRWAHYLVPLLTGRVQLVFAALPTADSVNYDEIKKAILQWYDINEEAYQRRFRSVVRGEGEINREHVVRLLELEKKWLKKYDSEKVYEAIVLEQFLNMESPYQWNRGSGCTKRSRTPV